MHVEEPHMRVILVLSFGAMDCRVNVIIRFHLAYADL